MSIQFGTKKAEDLALLKQLAYMEENGKTRFYLDFLTYRYPYHSYLYFEESSNHQFYKESIALDLSSDMAMGRGIKINYEADEEDLRIIEKVTHKIKSSSNIQRFYLLIEKESQNKQAAPADHYVFSTLSNNLLLRWETRPFYVRHSVGWRGRILHIGISEVNTDTGYRVYCKIVDGEKEYGFGLTKYKYTGGGNGMAPTLFNNGYSLHFKIGFGGLHIYEKTENNAGVHDKEYPFQLLTGKVPFPENKPVKAIHPELPQPSKKQEVTLYKFESEDSIRDSTARFDGNDLIVDKWVMGKKSYYEDEYAITIKPPEQVKLYPLLSIKKDDRSALLQEILDRFAGENGFDNFSKFLEEHQITFNNSVWHD